MGSEAQDKKIARVGCAGADSGISQGAPDDGNINPELEMLHREMAERGAAKIVQDVVGEAWTEAQVNSESFGAPDPVFHTGSELQEPWQYGRAGDSLQPMVHLPIHAVVGEYGQAPKTQDTVEERLGLADIQSLQGAEKAGARTITGMAHHEAQWRSKKK